MAWVETHSDAFHARHEEGDSEVAEVLLERLEGFRERLLRRFPEAPADVGVVIHPGPWHLALAHPWLPVARMATAPAGRRYFAGWFSATEIHVLTPGALAERASAVPGSREALDLSPLHEYAHLAIGSNNPALPPPFGLRGFRRYLRTMWLAEGAATFYAGQVPHLRPAVARRLREGGTPRFPPSGRDALILGGTIFALLERGAGAAACAQLALDPEPGRDTAIERAFARSADEVERDWREFLSQFAAGQETRRVSRATPVERSG